VSAAGQPDDFAAVRLALTDCRRERAPFPLAWSRALEVVPPAEGRTVAAVERKQAAHRARQASADLRAVA
jgi:hypothetical protein